MHAYLSPGRFIDSDHPSVMEFAEKHRGAGRDPLEQAINLYYAVREAVRYNPYTFSRDPETLRGSYALAAGESYCVPKATPAFNQQLCELFNVAPLEFDGINAVSYTHLTLPTTPYV